MTAVSPEMSTRCSEGFIVNDPSSTLAISSTRSSSSPSELMCLKLGARIDSTVAQSPSVIAVSQRLSCASTSAHVRSSRASGEFDSASEQLPAHAVACGATVKTAAGPAKTGSAIAHSPNTDRVMDCQYVSQATSTTANQ